MNENLFRVGNLRFKFEENFVIAIVVGCIILFSFYLVTSLRTTVELFSEKPAISIALDILNKNLLVDIAIFHGVMMLSHIVIGASVGTLVFFFWEGLLGEKLNKKSRIILDGISTFTVVVYFGLRCMVKQPVFFDELFNKQGGLLRAIQYWVTGYITLGSLEFVAILFTPIFVISLVIFLWRQTNVFLMIKSLQLRNWIILFSVILCFLLVLVVFKAVGGYKVNKGPNLLIIAIDSLRPDHLSCNEYERQTTPNIDSIAGKSVRFENTFVTLARTVASWTSILTSAYPHTHGIRHEFPSRKYRRLFLSTLPQVLKENGYKSVIVSDYAGDKFSAVNFGFNVVDAPPALTINIAMKREIILRSYILLVFMNNRIGHWLFPVLKFLPANANPEFLGDKVIKCLKKLKKEEKFFLLAFFSSPHVPFAPIYPYYKLYSDPNYRGLNKYAFYIREVAQIHDIDKPLCDSVRAQLVSLYDGAIKSVDFEVGRIIKVLKEKELMQNTVIVILSDHGQNLYENGTTVDHGKWFKGGDNANKIPFILYDPQRRYKPERFAQLVQEIDIMPTLLDVMNISKPETIEGISLEPIMKGEKTFHRPEVYGETGVWLSAPTSFGEDRLTYPSILELLEPDRKEGNLIVLKEQYESVVVEAKHRMIRTNDWKLVYIPMLRRVDWKLYNVNKDPDNRHNVIGENPHISERLRKKLIEWMEKDPGKKMQRDEHLRTERILVGMSTIFKNPRKSFEPW